MSKFFNFFSGHNTGDKKGVSKTEALKLKDLNFANFFKIFSIRFNTIVKSNGLFLLCNLPILFAVYAAAGYHNIKTRVPVDLFYPNIYGVRIYEGENAVTAALHGLFGFFANFSIPSKTTIVFYSLSLLCILTFGLSNTGLTYISRESVRGKPIMEWTDFWTAIKKNWKQGILLGILDLGIMYLLIYDLFVFYNISSDITGAIGFTVILVLSFTYLIMRNYLYLLTITFDNKIRKTLNYSFRLSLLGIKRNLAGIAAILLVIYLNFMIAQVFLPIGLLLPFIFTVGICAFIGSYTSWPVVEKYLVDTTKNKNKNLYEYYDLEDTDKEDHE